MVLESIVHLPALRHRAIGTHADECVPVFLDLHWLRGGPAAKAKRRCVFCSYGSVPCPPVQAERSGPTAAPRCCAG